MNSLIIFDIAYNSIIIVLFFRMAFGVPPACLIMKVKVDTVLVLMRLELLGGGGLFL